LHTGAEFEKLSEREQIPIYQEYGKLEEELKGRKVYLRGNPLKPTTTAATVPVRKGK
jgi:hypothetical protein